MININYYLLNEHKELLDKTKSIISNSLIQIQRCKEDLSYYLDLEYKNTINKINDLISLKDKIEMKEKQISTLETIDLEISEESNYKSRLNFNKPIPFETHTGMCYSECYYWDEFKDIPYDLQKCRSELVNMYSNINKINNIYTAIELHKIEIYNIIYQTIETIDIKCFNRPLKNRYYRLKNSIIKILQKNISLNLKKLIKLYQNQED